MAEAPRRTAAADRVAGAIDLVALIEVQQLAGGEPSLGVLQRGEQAPQPVGRELDIVINKGYEVAAGRLDSPVQGPANTLVFGQSDHLRAELLGQANRSVGGTVVHNHDLDLAAE